jgi:hypothetical protein
MGDWVKLTKDVNKEFGAGSQERFLFHGTSRKIAEEIAAGGYRKPQGKPSFWADADIAAHHAAMRGQIDESGPALIAVPMSAFDQKFLSWDERAIEDPVGRSYAAVRRKWVGAGQHKGGWRASLEACGCVEYDGAVSTEMLAGVIFDDASFQEFKAGLVADDAEPETATPRF